MAFVHDTGALRRSGMLRPRHAVRLVSSMRRWDKTPAGGVEAMAAAYPGETYVIDELGSLTFAEVSSRTDALAASLREAGVRPGDTVALMCRNHRGFVESAIAASKLGAVTLLLNTDFAAPQLAGVVEREQPVALIHDEEFSGLVAGVGSVPTYIGWADEPAGRPTLEQLIAAGAGRSVAPPPQPGRFVILSSGTTGTPKGVRRGGSIPLSPVLGFLDRVGLRTRETHVIAAPMFHGWGFFHLGLSYLLGTTVVMRRKFDPEATLALVAEHGATSMPMVPVMLQRVMELDPATRAKHDTSTLRAIPLGGSAIPGDLAIRAMDALGDVVFNSYGSTEVALASTATPADLRAAPGTAGTAMPGTAVRILGADKRPVPDGQTGVVFVGSELASDGYSGGGGKEVVDGLMSSGDLGHIDPGGRLFIDGREDDMIVSGGENVFPREVEDLLSEHPAVVEAAVVGVADDKFGQRLRAYVVARDPGALSEDDVRDHVKANLARYKVPRDVRFLDALPRNPSGKVVARELENAAAAVTRS